MRALVTGSTGYIGSRLVPVLLLAGYDVLAGARDPGKLADFDTSRDYTGDDTADVVSGHPDEHGDGSDGRDKRGQGRQAAVPVELDVMDADSCRQAMAAHGPVDVAYYLVHGLGEGDFARTDLHAAETFASAAAAAGVRRIVYLGGLVPDGEELSEHLASRRAVAQALREHAVGVDVVWLRAAVILGAGSTSYELIRHLVQELPVIPIPTWMRHRVQPIAVDDVLHYLLHSADLVLPAGGYDIAGPEVLPYRDLVALQARTVGVRRVLVPVPGIGTGLAGKVISAIVPLPGALVADLVDSLNNTMVADEDRIETLLPPPPGGVSGLVEALSRCAASPSGRVGVVGAGASGDALHRVQTDPDWAA